MTIDEALQWFTEHTSTCASCPANYDWTCSGAMSQRCSAYRIAVVALLKMRDAQIKT